MKQKTLADQYNYIHNKALWIANRYAKYAKNDLKDLPSQTYRASGDFDTIDYIDSTDFLCYFTYNTSCHCHPEYSRFEKTFPSSLLELGEDRVVEEGDEDDYLYDDYAYGEELEQRIKDIVKKEFDAAMTKIEAKKAQKILDDLKAKEAKEKMDRKKLAALKKQYPNEK